MRIPITIIKEEVKSITYNGEVVSKSDFTESTGKYHFKYYISTLSKKGIEQIGKIVNSFEIYVDKVGWFRCEC